MRHCGQGRLVEEKTLEMSIDENTKAGERRENNSGLQISMSKDP